MKGKLGFTLMEILIAVAIIGIMAAAISPLVMKYLATAEHKKVEAELETIANAMTAYLADNPNVAAGTAFSSIYPGYINFDHKPGVSLPLGGTTFGGGTLTRRALKKGIDVTRKFGA